jgi:hypothetical protein
VLHPDASVDDPALAATMVDAVLQGVAVAGGVAGSGSPAGVSSNTHPVHGNADGT